MFHRTSWQNKPGREIVALGLSCFSVGALLSSISTVFEGLPPFLSGFMMGLGAVLVGFSIVVNISGLQRCRAEHHRR